MGVGAPLPPQVFLEARFPTGQGQQNSCVWNGFPHALETEAWTHQSLQTDISRAFGYQETRAVQGWRDKDNGCFVRDAVDVCRRVGVVSANTMPYDERDYKTRPTPTAYQEAYRNRTAEFYAVPSAAAAMNAIHKGNCVLFAFSVYPSFADTGRTGEWATPKGRVEGGHLVCAEGFDQAKGSFLCTNWWGEEWGVDHPMAETSLFWLPVEGRRSYWWMPFEVFESKVVWDQFCVKAFKLEV